MAIDPALFKVRFPEWVSVADATIQMWIDDAVTILNESHWGTKYDLGLYYLSAHFLALGETSAVGDGASVNGVSSRGVDGTSIGYNVLAPENQSDAYYASTTYGQRYLHLKKSLGVTAFVI